MGNRAVICFGKYEPSALGIYVHWNGGRDSVESFLNATRQVMGDRLGDETYGAARLVQCVATYFPGALSVGLDKCENLDCDNLDNGLYEIDMAKLTIMGRKYHTGEEQLEYDQDTMAEEIVNKLPKREAIS